MLKLLKITFLIKRGEIDKLSLRTRMSTDTVTFEAIATSYSDEQLIPFMGLKYYLNDDVPTATFLEVMQAQMNGYKNYYKLDYINYLIDGIEDILTKSIPQINEETTY